ncbi:MAG: hypothetical protein M1828_004657 [Chrysothrix sp. TS-e1954]|nr:MAG: hypothetical protein M1828_004657 [Chrysothrix sp. TS-e1954]
MKLDVRHFQYLSLEDWRVLTAVETGSKNHEVVPTPLIVQFSGLRAGSNAVSKSISTLAKANLIAKVKNVKYDGYRLTYGGLDYLALHSHVKTSAIMHVGNAMGVGKESDILLITSPAPSSKGEINVPTQSILKIHRLGRTSFRTATNNRAYRGNRTHCTWQELSRLSAQKEFAAMRALHSAGFRVPTPIAQNRHTVVMSLVPGTPLLKVPMVAFGSAQQNQDVKIAQLYTDCVELALTLAEVGVIHGDLNEFNILVENVPEADEDEDDGTDLEEPGKSNTTPAIKEDLDEVLQPDDKPMIPHLIDFPQITSFSHPQANEYFDRDIKGIKAWFRKRYHFESDDTGPTFQEAMERLLKSNRTRLDTDIEAAGYSKRIAKELKVAGTRNAARSTHDETTTYGDSDDYKSEGLHDASALRRNDGAASREDSAGDLLTASALKDVQGATVDVAIVERLGLHDHDTFSTVGTPHSKKASGWSI